MNKDLLKETPDVYEIYVDSNLKMLHQVLKEQVFLQDCGVSFEYTDSLLAFERARLIGVWSEWNEEKNKRSNV